MILIANKNMPSSSNKESLFGIDCDIDTPMKIDVKHLKSRTVMKPGDKYPMLFKGMTRKDFSSCNLSHLQKFLAGRGINKTGNKDTLVASACNAYKMKLEIIKEKNEVGLNLQTKLVLENGLVRTRSLKINRWLVCCTIQFAKQFMNWVIHIPERY